MEGQIASFIWREIEKRLVAPIESLFGFLCCYNDTIKNMRDQVDILDTMRDGVQNWVEVDKRNNLDIPPQIEVWLRKVNEIKTEADEFFRRAEAVFNDAAEVENGCFNGWFPNLMSRFMLSSEAAKKTQLLVKLQDEGDKYTKLSYPAPTVRMASTSTAVFKDFESRMSTMKDIIEELKKDETSLIGICGMGGVGKTTMVEKVAARVKAENLFQEVVTMVVSQIQDLMKIQGDLAGLLDLKLDEKIGIRARAEKLRQRLTRDYKILVILDDVWKEIDFEIVGIPVKGEHKGCKVVLTSRDENVCRDMGIHKNFTVGLLSKEEAWELFKETAGDSVDATDILPIAKQVVEQCADLPIAIVTVGKALNNRPKQVWNDALRQLRKSIAINIRGMHEKVYLSIELSYNYLLSDQARSLLLLCCLFQEDHNIPIESLVSYGVGLRWFEDLENLAETRDRVYSLVHDIRSCHLLQAVDEGHVKMHDVIRDVCIWIASKEGYMVRHDTKLREWPQNDKYQPYKAISLLSGQMHELPAGLDCPRLELLQVICTINSPEIPIDFFQGMKELRVVAFMGVCVEAPPLLPQFLINLRTLCLYHCRLGDISVIGSLKNLEILSFFDSHLKDLPSEFAQLSNLKLLDMRCRVGPGILPPGVLSNLYGLEELYIRNNYWAEEGYERNASITELNLLSHLNALEICIPDAKLLPREIWVEKLMRFKITIGGHRTNLDRYELFQLNLISSKYELFEFLNSLTFHGDVTTLLETSWIKSLVRRTEKLCLTAKGLRNVVKELDEEAFVNLKNLKMVACEDVKYLIDAMDPVPGNAFINLESLKIVKLGNLKEICHGNLPMESFGRLQEVQLSYLPVMKHLWRGPIQPPCLSNLRVLHLIFCKEIESLFPRSVVKCLVQLQQLIIQCCEMVKEIVSGEEGEDETEKIEFPKLKELTLGYLPRLRRFDPRMDILGSKFDCDGAMQPLFNQQVLLPSMETLEISWLDNLVQVMGGHMQAGFLYKLRKMAAFGCDSMEAVFDFEGLKVRGEHVDVILSHLESLELLSLPNLTHTWRMVPKGIQGFQNLRLLTINDCDALRYLLSSSMAQLLVKLQDLELKRCEMMEKVIETEKDEESMEMILFPQLKDLTLEDLPSLKIFVYESFSSKWSSLKKLTVRHCPKLKTFQSATQNTQKTKTINVINDETLQESISNSSTLQHLFNEKIEVSSLEELHISGKFNSDVIWHDQLSETSFWKLRKICVDDCDELLNVVLSNFLPHARNLEELSIGKCISLVEFFEVEDGQKEMTSKFRLKGISIDDGISVFKNLTKLTIWDCCNLRSLLPHSVAICLLQLRSLEVRNCKLLEELVTAQGEEERMDKIVFPLLWNMEIENLENLTFFCSWNYDFKFPSLRYVCIVNCPKMKTFSFGRVSTPKLDGISVENYESVWMGDLNNTITHLNERARKTQSIAREDVA